MYALRRKDVYARSRKPVIGKTNGCWLYQTSGQAQAGSSAVLGRVLDQNPRPTALHQTRSRAAGRAAGPHCGAAGGCSPPISSSLDPARCAVTVAGLVRGGSASSVATVAAAWLLSALPSLARAQSAESK